MLLRRALTWAGRAARLGGLAAALGCGGSSATAPTPIERNIVALGVECQPTLIVGETRPCVAVASMADGRMPLVSPVASWSTSSPSIVSVSAIGDVRGVSAGRSAVHVSYGGRQASTEVTVLPGDAVKVAWVADQGAFAPGTSVTMWTGGFYALQSADTGTLQVLIYNQRGVVTVVGNPQEVQRGGDAFALTVSFQVPASSTRLCRRVRLTVGPIRVEEPSGADADSLCVAVQNG